MPTPILSIIIPVCDQPDFTVKCFHSIRYHTTLPYEVIWVDNCSRPENREIILRQAKQPGFHCKLVRNSDNLGFIKATNQGISVATGKYLVFLNNDTEVFPGWDKALTMPLEKYKKVGAVGAVTQSTLGWQNAYYINDAFGTNIPPHRHPETYIAHAKKIFKSHGFKYLNITKLTLAFFCTAFRKDTVDELGGLCEELSIGLGDDDEYCSRLRHAGYETWLSLGTFVYHAHRTTFTALNLGIESLRLHNLKILKRKEKEKLKS